jgi:hypothetical protein
MKQDQVGTNVSSEAKPVDNYRETRVAGKTPDPRIPQGFHN